MSDASTYTTIGAILAIAASVCNAVGYTVQKKGHNRLKEYNKDKEDSEKKRLIKEKIWAAGFAIYLIGGLLNAVALFYAPQSLVLPLSATTLVVNTMLATKVLGEPFFKADIFGILSVITGSVLAVMFGPRTAGGEATMNELKLRWGDRDFFLFFIVLSACIVADYLLVRFYERKNANDETVTDELKHGSSMLLISYCLLAGYFGALAFLFLKSFTEFIGSSASSKKNADENAVNWYSYFTLICVIITNFALEFFRQRGLAYFHAVYVVPINQVVLIVMGTIMGGLYFEEFDAMNLLDGILFIIAILMTVIGVFILAFNSGNVSDKTDAKINHTLTLSLDVTQHSNRDNTTPVTIGGTNINFNINLPNLPSLLQTSPSLPITRNMHDEIPDFPPPGMTGTISRIHGLHRTMASMHFSKDGKPFYLDKNSNKLSVLSVIGVSSVSSRSIYKQQQQIRRNKMQKQNSDNDNGHGHTGKRTRHIKHSQSLPTYSNSSLDVIAVPNSLEIASVGVGGELKKISLKGAKEYNSRTDYANVNYSNASGSNGKNGINIKSVRFKDINADNEMVEIEDDHMPTLEELDAGITIVTKESMSISDYKPKKYNDSNIEQ